MRGVEPAAESSGEGPIGEPSAVVLPSPASQVVDSPDGGEVKVLVMGDTFGLPADAGLCSATELPVIDRPRTGQCSRTFGSRPDRTSEQAGGDEVFAQVGDLVIIGLDQRQPDRSDTTTEQLQTGLDQDDALGTEDAGEDR